MNCTAEMLRLYAVTDRAWVGEQTLPQQVEAALKGGATCVQLREKDLGDAAILAEALEISALCKRYGVPFILNDNVALARQCGADGVHLGQEDMDPAEARRILGPEAIIGVSAHNVAEARAAVEAGADYLGCGAMFATATKTNVTALPKETLRDICAAVPIPVVAIGGIHKCDRGGLYAVGPDGGFRGGQPRPPAGRGGRRRLCDGPLRRDCRCPPDRRRGHRNAAHVSDGCRVQPDRRTT